MRRIFFGIALSIFCLSAIVVAAYCWYNFLHLRSLREDSIPLGGKLNVAYCATLVGCDHAPQKISIPAFFTPGLLQTVNDFRGFVIAAGKFFVPKHFKSEYVLLHLGKIGDADRTYINDKIVGSSGDFPPREFSAWNKTRYYLFSSTILKNGTDNFIKIEIACYGFNRIIGNAFIKQITKEEYNRLQLIETVKNFFPLFCNVGIGFVFMIIFLMLCYNKSERIKYLLFLAHLVPGIFVVIEPVMPFALYSNTIVRMKIFGVAWSALVFVHILFLHRIYLYKRYIVEIALGVFTLLVVLVILAVKETDGIKAIGKYVVTVLTSLALYNVSLHAEQLIKRNDIAKLFMPIGLILAITASHDGFVYLSVFTMKIYSIFGYEFSSPIFHYTSGAIFIGAGLIVVYQYIGMSKEIENMNIILENKVEERTRELKTSLENLSKAIELGMFDIKSKSNKYFSAQLEPKIKQAIVFINNNFSDNISREGFAAMLDIHHDYFSKAFKYYTGKSLNDYIYTLRIKEAIKLLVETNTTILDIAMQVGFESVKTFNRAFKKFTGKNPKDYRK